MPPRIIGEQSPASCTSFGIVQPMQAAVRLVMNEKLPRSSIPFSTAALAGPPKTARRLRSIETSQRGSRGRIARGGLSSGVIGLRTFMLAGGVACLMMRRQSLRTGFRLRRRLLDSPLRAKFRFGFETGSLGMFLFGLVEIVRIQFASESTAELADKFAQAVSVSHGNGTLWPFPRQAPFALLLPRKQPLPDLQGEYLDVHWPFVFAVLISANRLSADPAFYTCLFEGFATGVVPRFSLFDSSLGNDPPAALARGDQKHFDFAFSPAERQSGTADFSGFLSRHF
jgi:hypothetical protein